MEAASTHNLPVYSVTELSSALKKVIETNFTLIRIRGEVSGFKRATSGHLYFTLKDQDSNIDAVCWKGVSSHLSIQPEDGIEIICTGKITTYPGRSKYQLVIEHVELAGLGALLALLDKRKAQFEKEGLFDPARKKPIPYMPRRIGVVTSTSGAVIRDILHRLQDRFPCHVIIWPVSVQGNGAVGEVTRAIQGFNALALDSPLRPDVIIVARGGGSLEDLWAFNEEAVVRAAFASVIPLISAIGHETDTTLIDFVSDLRAPTPTAAAEFAVPIKRELSEKINLLSTRMSLFPERAIHSRRERLDLLSRPLNRGGDILNEKAQRLDDLGDNLRLGLSRLIERKQFILERGTIARLSGLLRTVLTQKSLLLSQKTKLVSGRGLLNRLQIRRDKIHHVTSRLPELAKRTIEQRQQKLTQLGAMLDALSYTHTLKRGYTLIEGTDGKVVTSASKLKADQAFNVHFHDGVVKIGPKLK